MVAPPPTPTPTPPAPRRGRPGHDQAAVLAAAVELSNRKGYDATSVGDVADALGITKSAIYHHVESKGQLLARALDGALGGLEAAVDDASRAGGERAAYDRLREVVRRSVEVLVAQQAAVTLLLRVRGNSPTERDGLRRRREVDARLTALVRAAIDEGGVRSDLDPELVSRLLFGTVNSLVEWYRPDGALGADELATTLTAMVFEGLATPSG